MSGPEKVQGPVAKLVAVDNSTVVAYIRNPPDGDVCSPVENHDLVPSLPDNSKSQAHSRVPDYLTYCPGQTKSNQQNGHCIRRCSNRSVKSGSLIM